MDSEASPDQENERGVVRAQFKFVADSCQCHLDIDTGGVSVSVPLLSLVKTRKGRTYIRAPVGYKRALDGGELRTFIDGLRGGACGSIDLLPAAKIVVSDSVQVMFVSSSVRINKCAQTVESLICALEAFSEFVATTSARTYAQFEVEKNGNLGPDD